MRKKSIVVHLKNIKNELIQLEGMYEEAISVVSWFCGGGGNDRRIDRDAIHYVRKYDCYRFTVSIFCFIGDAVWITSASQRVSC